MHSSYQPTVDKIAQWASQNTNVQAAVIIGSQIRKDHTGDEWSDLDLLILANNPNELINHDHWICQFGKPICITKEVISLDFINLTWYVKRPLYDDFRAIDFSILPFSRLDDVLRVNQDIHYCGYEIIYSESTKSLEEKFKQSIASVTGPQLPGIKENEFNDLVNDLLYHIIWALRKIKRNELWTAVHCINCYMKDKLLTLLEMHNAVTGKNLSRVMYEGRLLESRINPSLLKQLYGCFTKYDPSDAVETLYNLYNIISVIAAEIAKRQEYVFNHALFNNVKEMYQKMSAEQ